MLKTTRVAYLIFLSLIALAGQGRDYARSMVISPLGIAATGNPLASEAAARILEGGGSAVDAAIAANAVMGVVDPGNDGLGGDLFVLYWDAGTGKLTGLNASGPAPQRLSPELLARRNLTQMPIDGIHTVTVPGAVDGWRKMHQRFGKLPWSELFDVAVAAAEQGFAVTEDTASYWGNPTVVNKLQRYQESARVFLPGGKPPRQGDLFRNPSMAHALRLIAEKGAYAFYRGEIADAIVTTSQRLDGTISKEDLASFSSEWVEPIQTEYKGWRVYELPPNSQGFAALEMLNIMEAAAGRPRERDSAEEIHTRIEAMKLAYVDLRRYNADPRTSSVPVGLLLSKEYARTRVSLINPERANCDVRPGTPEGADTIHVAIVDKNGNIASWIQSLRSSFGSGITVDGMGFALQNRGKDFTLEPGHPNLLGGGKRPFHTIIPAFMERGDEHIGFGIVGGETQPLSHAQFVSNIADYGMNIQGAVEAPRFAKRSASGCDVMIESRVPAHTLQQLSDRGHLLAMHRAYSSEMGIGQVVLHDSKAKMNYGAADPRADGVASPQLIRR